MDSGESELRAPFAFEGESHIGVFVFRSGVSAMSRSPRLSQWTPMKTILTVDRDCGPSSKLAASCNVQAHGGAGRSCCVFNTTRKLSRTPKHGGLYRYGTEACDRVGPRL